jgi:hypothetical protein
MSFEPIETDCRRSLGTRLGYAVRKKNESANGRLRISICSDLMRKTNFGDGDLLRLEVDAASGLGRLVAVMVTGNSTRRVEIRSEGTGRGHWELPWTGDVPRFFPACERMEEMELVEVKAGELTFELPRPPKGGTTEREKGGAES